MACVRLPVSPQSFLSLAVPSLLCCKRQEGRLGLGMRLLPYMVCMYNRFVYLCVLQCLVIGEITCDHMIVVLNKIDLVEPSKRETQVAKVTATQPVSLLTSSK